MEKEILITKILDKCINLDLNKLYMVLKEIKMINKKKLKYFIKKNT